MRFTVLSHAGLAVEHGETQLLVDPWIVGSCYWRSWWNLPEPPRDLIDGLAPTHIYLTHLHWDHFHGPSLRRFPRSTPILVPTFNNDRMRRDLAFLGFHDVRELEHGETVDLDGIRVQSYQFVNDSAVAISDGTTTLLDANDCKLFGLPLNQVLDDHPRIDVVLRSHSNASAYPYCIEGYEELFPELRPRQAYMDEFTAFAGAVGARYAVPFASNHCFLHPETKRFNGLAVLPTEVKARFDEIAAQDDRLGECVVMSPGSRWSPETGFDLASFDYSDVAGYVERKSIEHADTISARVAAERETEFDDVAFTAYFERFLRAAPRPARSRLGTFEFRIVEHDAERSFAIDALDRIVEERAVADPTFSIRCQAAIINDCVRYDMFSVWTPSKRLSVRVRDRSAVDALLLFFNLLDGLELDYLPLRRLISRRVLRSAVRRWREPAEALRTLVAVKLLRRPFEPWPRIAASRRGID